MITTGLTDEKMEIKKVNNKANIKYDLYGLRYLSNLLKILISEK